MTALQPRDVEQHLPVAATPAGTIEAAEALDGAGLVQRGDWARDAIVLSVRAALLIRAGLAVRALVMTALMHADKILRLPGRTIVLEFGVYR